MCSVYDVKDKRAYARNCSEVKKMDPNRDRSYTSIDLDAEYDGICPYYKRYSVPLKFYWAARSFFVIIFLAVEELLILENVVMMM